MTRPVNIWSQVLWDLHPKAKTLIDDLNKNGQIDHDENNHPYLISADRVKNQAGKLSPTMQINVIRNGKAENIILHTRKRVDPVMSFNPDDGWKRLDMPRIPMMKDDPSAPRRERPKRVVEGFDLLVDQILGDIEE